VKKKIFQFSSALISCSTARCSRFFCSWTGYENDNDPQPKWSGTRSGPQQNGG